MKTKIILIALVFCTSIYSFSQTIFKGKVIDAQTKETISNVKIGITNQGVGVLSNKDGLFVYKKYQETLADTDQLFVSALGYERITLDAEEVRSLFNRSSTIQLEKTSETKAISKIENIKIFWDISEGMQDRDLEQELVILGNYLDSLGKVSVTLEIFNNKIVSTDFWQQWDGDIDRFRESVTKKTYNAPSNYSILFFDEADAVILVSNGEPNYGKLAVSQDQPVYVVSSIKTKAGLSYLKKLIEYTSSSLLDIKAIDVKKKAVFDPAVETNQKEEIISIVQTEAITTGPISRAKRVSSPPAEGNENRDQIRSKNDQNNVITGAVTGPQGAIQGAEVFRKGSFDIAQTKVDGSFELNAKDGDFLIVTALGMFSKEIAITNKNTYKIELIPSDNYLDEVVLVAERELITVGNKKMKGDRVPNIPGGITTGGNFYITSKDIIPNAKTLEQVLFENFKKIQYSTDLREGTVLTVNGGKPTWVVNEQVLIHEPPPFYLSDKDIESIVVVEPRVKPRDKFGNIVNGGVIIVTTKSKQGNSTKNQALVEGNDYVDEVRSINDQQTTISGTVTGPQGHIQGAEVLRKGSLDIATTGSDGRFQLKAENGDVLIVSAFGMFPKTVSDKKNYAIQVLPNEDLLDEVVVKGEQAKIEKSKSQEIFGYGPEIGTGRYKLKGFGSFNVTTITKDDFKFEMQPDMGQALFGRFESVYVYKDPTKPNYGRPYMLRGAFEQPLQLFIDGQLELGTVYQVNPSEVISISIKSDMTGSFNPALLIDTNRSEFTSKEGSVLVKDNEYTEEVKEIKTTQQITGTVTGPQGPIQGAEVLRKDSFDVTTTDINGNFDINVKENDILIVSALGMFSKEIPVTNELNYVVTLLPDGDLLNEVEVTGEGTDDKTIDTAYGKRNPDAVGYDVKTLTSEDIKDNFYSIVDVLNGRFANVIAKQSPTGFNVFGGRVTSIAPTPMLIDIDGQIFSPLDSNEPGAPPRGAPIIDPSRIESISIIKGLAGVTRYGKGAEGGVVIIKTKGMSGNALESTVKRSALVTGNDYEEEISEVRPAQQITGVIASGKGPIKKATITKKGTFVETMSDDAGNFIINASIDDILVISALNMFPKEILIDKQNLGTIILTPKTNDLDAIVLEGEERVDNTVETQEGKINADKLGYTAETLDENSFSSGYTTLRQLITGKVAGVDVAGGLYSGSEVVYKIRGGTQSIQNEKPPIWIVNGTPYEDPPNFLDVQQIKSITVLKSTMATSRYGSLAAGGAFLIKTKEADFKNKAAACNKSALVSGNEYTGDVTGGIYTALPSYILRFRESGTPQQQLALYKRLSRTQESPLEYYVDAAQYFQSIDLVLGDEVRSDLAYIARNNTKALRTLAYLYELVNDTENVVLVNERIVKIAPQEAQSYRDLALAYQNNKQFDKALELYINMLGEQILGVNFEGLEKPLRSELSRLVAMHKDKIDFERLPNEWLRTDFKIDMRMVIDWSDRSVPFEFQFVNPQKKFFKWTHTLEETRDRLQAEQKQGFQTEEFIIDDAPPGE